MPSTRPLAISPVAKCDLMAKPMFPRSPCLHAIFVISKSHSISGHRGHKVCRGDITVLRALDITSLCHILAPEGWEMPGLLCLARKDWPTIQVRWPPARKGVVPHLLKSPPTSRGQRPLSSCSTPLHRAECQPVLSGADGKTVFAEILTMSLLYSPLRGCGSCLPRCRIS